MEKQQEIEYYEMAYRREKAARKESERILEQKAIQLYKTNRALNDLNKSLEEKLEERLNVIKYSEERFENFIKNANDMIYRTDVSGCFTYMNPYGEECSEYTVDEILGSHFTEYIIYPSKQEIANFYLQQFAERKLTTYFEYQIRTKSGKTKWLGQNVQILFEHNSDRIAGFLAIARDITKRVEAVDKLAFSEEKYRGLFNKMKDGLLFSSPEGVIEIVNPSLCRMLGYKEHELVGRIGYDVLHAEEQAKLLRSNTKKRSEGISDEYETVFLHKDGRNIWTHIIAHPHYNERGEFKGVMSIISDVSEKKQIEREREMVHQQLKQSEEKYRGLLESLNLGVVEVDQNETITHVFDGFCQLTGYTKEELIGKNPSSFLIHDDCVDILKEQHQKRRKGESEVYELRMIKKNGEVAWVIISGAPYYDQQGKFTGSIGITLDISDRKKMEEDLIKAKEKAVDNAKYKELFLANMSHEIRTPLNGVIGLAQLLGKTELNEIQTEYISTIKQSASNLLGIVGDILDFSKIGAGQLELESIDFELLEIVQNVKNSFEFYAYEKGISMMLEVEGEFGPAYRGDSLRLSQVLTNLVNNAMKFTEEGSVSIHLSMIQKGEGFDKIKFEVKDTGIGIDEDAQQKIFEEFAQAEGSTTRKYGGTGLGLNICKKIVEMMNGELAVQSIKGEGSTFHFILEIPHGTEVEKEDSIPSDFNWANARILLAEDNKVNQFVASGFIENWGGSVTICENGNEVLDELAKTDFDIILMDIQMPHMNGISCTKIIRKRINKTIPIVALTANAIKGDRERFIRAGMNDYVSKPFDEHVLKSKMIKYLSTGPTQEKTEEEEVPKTKTKMNGSTQLSLNKLEKMSGGNQDFISRMLETFLSEAQQDVAVFDSGDQEKISRQAHKMKPSIDYIGQAHLSALIRKIEANENMKKPELLDDFKQQLRDLMNEVEHHLSQD